MNEIICIGNNILFTYPNNEVFMILIMFAVNFKGNIALWIKF